MTGKEFTEYYNGLSEEQKKDIIGVVSVNNKRYIESIDRIKQISDEDKKEILKNAVDCFSKRFLDNNGTFNKLFLSLNDMILTRIDRIIDHQVLFMSIVFAGNNKKEKRAAERNDVYRLLKKVKSNGITFNLFECVDDIKNNIYASEKFAVSRLNNFLMVTTDDDRGNETGSVLFDIDEKADMKIINLNGIFKTAKNSGNKEFDYWINRIYNVLEEDIIQWGERMYEYKRDTIYDYIDYYLKKRIKKGAFVDSFGYIMTPSSYLDVIKKEYFEDDVIMSITLESLVLFEYIFDAYQEYPK